MAFMSSFILFGMDRYLRSVLRQKADYFPLTMVGFYFFLGLMAFNESMSGNFDIIARILSLFTTALMFWALSYFEDGIPWIRRNALGIVIGFIVLGITALVLGRLDNRIWLVTETLFSIVSVLVFCTNIAVTFYKRRLTWLILVPCVTMVLLGHTQVVLLSEEKCDLHAGASHAHVAHAFLPPALDSSDTKAPKCQASIFPDLNVNLEAWRLDFHASRLLSRPMLLVCILLLSLSWVGGAGASAAIVPVSNAQKSPNVAPQLAGSGRHIHFKSFGQPPTPLSVVYSDDFPVLDGEGTVRLSLAIAFPDVRGRHLYEMAMLRKLGGSLEDFERRYDSINLPQTEERIKETIGKAITAELAQTGQAIRIDLRRYSLKAKHQNTWVFDCLPENIVVEDVVRLAYGEVALRQG